MRLLCRAPEHRFASMEELAVTLAALTGSARPAEPSRVNTAAYPFPIAHADRMIWGDIDDNLRLQRLLFAFEAAIKLCASVALLARASPEKPLPADQTRSLIRPSLGHWVGLLRLATLEDPAAAWQVLGRLGAFAHGNTAPTRGLDLFDRAVQARNRIAHGSGLGERDCHQLFEDLLPVWQRVLAELSFLAAWPLGKVLRLRYEGGRFLVTYRSYMGDNPTFRVESAEIKAPVEEGKFGLLEPAGLLDLTPLVQALECGRCGDEEIFFYNGLRGGKLDLLSYQKGHDVVVPADLSTFQRRGLGW
jgi:hypothetical protein